AFPVSSSSGAWEQTADSITYCPADFALRLTLLLCSMLERSSFPPHTDIPAQVLPCPDVLPQNSTCIELIRSRVEQAVRRMRCDSATVRQVSELTAYACCLSQPPNRTAVRHLMAVLGPEQFGRLMAIQSARFCAA